MERGREEGSEWKGREGKGEREREGEERRSWKGDTRYWSLIL